MEFTPTFDVKNVWITTRTGQAKQDMAGVYARSKLAFDNTDPGNACTEQSHVTLIIW